MEAILNGIDATFDAMYMYTHRAKKYQLRSWLETENCAYAEFTTNNEKLLLEFVPRDGGVVICVMERENISKEDFRIIYKCVNVCMEL